MSLTNSARANISTALYTGPPPYRYSGKR